MLVHAVTTSMTTHEGEPQRLYQWLQTSHSCGFLVYTSVHNLHGVGGKLLLFCGG